MGAVDCVWWDKVVSGGGVWWWFAAAHMCRGLGAGVEKACREPIREIDLVLGALIGRYEEQASGWMQMSECRTFPRCEGREPSDELPICRLHYFPFHLHFQLLLFHTHLLTSCRRCTGTWCQGALMLAIRAPWSSGAVQSFCTLDWDIPRLQASRR